MMDYYVHSYYNKIAMSVIKKSIPNIITSIRIIGAIIILFLEPFTLPFYIVYGVAGVSDALDGFIARKFHLESKFGSILDSVSDWIFLGVMAVKIAPTLIELLAIWNWIIFAVPLGLQIIAYIICAFKFKRFSSIHTYMNKLMSASIFFYPFVFIGFIRPLYEIYGAIFGSLAILGSIELIIIHLISKEYNERNKTIFLLKKNENSHQEVIE